jgi:hypothetical protein
MACKRAGKKTFGKLGSNQSHLGQRFSFLGSISCLSVQSLRFGVEDV